MTSDVRDPRFDDHRVHAIEHRRARRAVEARMRVLQLGKYYAPYRGGIEHHLQMLCGELAHKDDMDLDVVVSDSRPANGDGVVGGVRVKRCFEVAKVASTSNLPDDAPRGVASP